MKRYRNETVERIAERRLTDLARQVGAPIEPPIPIDLLAERVLGLDFLWEEIEELPGETVLGGLDPWRRLIVLNDRHRGLFEDKPGLERSTKGHEMGHWDLFWDKAVAGHPALPSLDPPRGVATRRTDTGQVEVLPPLLRQASIVDLVRALQSRADDPGEARAVNRYAAAIAMPRSLIAVEAARIDRTRWRDLYRLAERFQVTITALKVRLEELGFLRVVDRYHLYSSPALAAGQLTLPGLD